MAAVLESLCRKGASGVLEVEGNPAGAIYLDQGQITFARSSWVPDLTARLCGALRPSPELRTFLRGSDQSDRNSGALLVRRGYMSENDLRSILRSAVIDALIVLTMPLSGGSSVLDIRFEAPSAHWAAAFLCLSLESVQPDVSRRAAQMARAGVAHTAPIALRDLDRPSAVLTRSQWALASRVDGALTPRDLARQSGLSLYETITSLGALIRRGLCAPAGLASPGGDQPVPGATVSSVPPAAVPTTPVPPDALTRLVTRTAAPSHRHRTHPAVPAPAAPSPAETAPAQNGSAANGQAAPAPRLNGAAVGHRDTLAGSPRPAAPGGAVAYATSGAPATSATWDTTGTPSGRPSFTPAVTPTPLTSPELSGRPVVSAAAVPGPQKPAVDPAPVDVPAGALGSQASPSYPAYRRSPQQQWPLSEAPVPPATPGGPSPATPDADAQCMVPARPAAADGYPVRASRGAHRAHPPSRPETDGTDRNDRNDRTDRTRGRRPAVAEAAADAAATSARPPGGSRAARNPAPPCSPRLAPGRRLQQPT